MLELKSTFRDPDARLTIGEERVLRSVTPAAAPAFAAILAHPLIKSLMDEGDLVETRLVPSARGAASNENTGACYEHKRIPFIAYPNEWGPAMLARAGEFTMTLALRLLEQGFILKDATPANVLFRSARPVFVDLPSIVRRPTGAFVWQAQDQFERCFLLPLVATVEAGIPLAWSLRDAGRGITHEHLAKILGARKWLRLSNVVSVAVPAYLNKAIAKPVTSTEPRTTNDERAQFTLGRVFKRNLARVRALARRLPRSHSTWSSYTEQRGHYSADDVAKKSGFVRAALAAAQPAWVLDVGANTGEHSRYAAAVGASVVAIDTDEVSVDKMFYAAERDSERVLPLVVDFGAPTPPTGWLNCETASFVHRSMSRFDVVLLLAVIHHLRVTAGVPIDKILAAVARLATSGTIIEHVPVEDEMFKRLSRGRDALYADCSRDQFEALLNREFVVDRSLLLSNGRKLYFARKKLSG